MLINKNFLPLLPADLILSVSVSPEEVSGKYRVVFTFYYDVIKM